MNEVNDKKARKKGCLVSVLICVFVGASTAILLKSGHWFLGLILFACAIVLICRILLPKNAARSKYSPGGFRPTPPPPLPIAQKYTTEMIQSRLKQVRESADLVNSTVKPDVFFGRLGFLLDTLLDLMTQEKFAKFTTKPSTDYYAVVEELPLTVNKFIERAVAAECAIISELKTESGKAARWKRFESTMLTSFANATALSAAKRDTSGRFPSYTGGLYSPENYKYLRSLLSDNGEQFGEIPPL